MLKLRAGFKAIDARFNTIVGHLDHMGECFDRHDTRLEHVEDQISKVEDNTAKMTKRLEVLESHLRTVAIKNEDL
ncbi:hypothetical protein NDU88_004442 [Pleurodeles waltl]|uniref:Uncharacterized protein n=1 Tax=Pleurodeles waltl TaxID=8319 RepID=A0AAV7PE10_PLEWA|nr:hypothetical protein NDU88_004442 [Pleurodeles waltl]